MTEQDRRGSLSAKSKPVLYLPSGQRAYDRAMSGVERSSGTTSESGTLEGVRGGTGELRTRAGGPAKREPCPTSGIIEVIHAVPRSKNMLGMRVSTVASKGDFLED